MKINITIEIDDKELKGLLFEEEKPKEETEIEHEWDVWFDTRFYADYFYGELCDLAKKYSQIDLETYKKFMNEEAYVDLPIHDNDLNIGWTFEDIKKAKITRSKKGYGYAYKITLPEPVRLQWW